MPEQVDIAIVGGGAAGLAAAIFAARARSGRSIAIFDGAKRIGAKILVSGGGRCNVTNVRVTPDDFRGGSRNSIRRVLQHFPVPETIAFFNALGVTLHEEEDGKLFPATNSARTVLDALLAEASRMGVQLQTGHRVSSIQRSESGFVLETNEGNYVARRLILATGGQSLPKTGSNGAGYELARSLGHSIIPTAPALAPLVLDGTFHAELSGIAHPAELAVLVGGERPLRLRGSLLWTHFGVSGPVVLDASGPWHRARLEGRSVRIELSFLPGEGFDAVEQRLIGAANAQPRMLLHNALQPLVPARVGEALLSALGIGSRVPLAHLARADRRRLVHALTGWTLPVRDSRGYQYAEVTSGGVTLTEVDPGTLASRCCPGLSLVGEILDVDGRIGGFNFQWAWSSGKAAGSAAAL